MQQETIDVRFIGRKAPFIDNLYKSNLPFEKNQVRSVPVALAKQLLKHQDLFEVASGKQKKPADSTVTDVVDDTASVLEQTQQEQQEQNEEQNRIEDIRLRVMTTENKEELIDMAMTHWQQPLKKTQSLNNLRAAVIQYIDQFGFV